MGAEEEGAVADAIATLSVRRDGEGWVGETPVTTRRAVFGGFLIGQAVMAATRDAPQGRRLHSLHAYFLRPVQEGKPVSYRITSLREGRTIVQRRLDAEQEGKHVLTMSFSFAADSEGYEYQPSSTAVAMEPGRAPNRSYGPWEMVALGLSPAIEPDGSWRSTSRMWFRTSAPLPDDPHLHTALTAFATDITHTGARPLHPEGDTRGIISLDHAVWFHRPLRPDDWCWYDVSSVINTAGRGLLRGAMYSSDGRLCATAVQETLLKRYEDVQGSS
jgi:acyl-CoA thioesterase II